MLNYYILHCLATTCSNGYSSTTMKILVSIEKIALLPNNSNVGKITTATTRGRAGLHDVHSSHGYDLSLVGGNPSSGSNLCVMLNNVDSWSLYGVGLVVHFGCRLLVSFRRGWGCSWSLHGCVMIDYLDAGC